MNELRSLSFTTQPSTFRRATLHGREHIVVPVVALVGDSIIRPMGSTGPEYVPGDMLANCARSWNGRPIVANHPSLNGAPLSALSPEVADTYNAGTVYNARYEDGRMKAEMWLDTSLSAAQTMIERVLAGEVMEVSVGASVLAEKKAGLTPTGKPYDARWLYAQGDHLAVLPSGTAGACSVAMGCGAPRAATAVAAVVAPTTKEPRMTVAAALGLSARAAEDLGTSDSELHSKLHSLLHTSEPAFEWITDIFPDSKTVIYSASPDRTYKNFKRTYSVSATDEVTLNDDRVEVEPHMTWEPVTAIADTAAPDGTTIKAAAKKLSPWQRLMRVIRDMDLLKDVLGPVDTDTASDDTTTEESVTAAAESPATGSGGDTANEGDNCMCQIKELAGRLIANGPFEEGDRAALEAFGEVKLQALLAANPPTNPGTGTPPANPGTGTPGTGTPAPGTPTPAPNPAPKAEALAALSEADVLTAFPDIRAAVEANKAHEKAVRTAMVAALTPVINGAWTPAQLAAKPLDELRSLVHAFKLGEPATDFSLIGLAAPPVVKSERRKIPDSYGLDKAPATATAKAS